MSWKIRHAGSPKNVDVNMQQIVAGLQDGHWEASDEVVGPGENRWTPIEKHPHLEELVTEMEEADAEARKIIDDPEEQRLDMNPLIDVCLVLLIFFILATTLQVMEKVLDVPSNRTEGPGRLREVKEEEVNEVMIRVLAVKEGGREVIKIEDREVPTEDLERSLRRFKRETRKTQILIDAKDVSWGTVVKVLDAAAGCSIKNVYFRADRSQIVAPAPASPP